MEVKVEKMGEKNMYRLIIEANAEEFEKGVQKAYERNKGRLSIPGFRKGKAPRNIIEKMYGKTVFYNDAADIIVPELYEKAAADSDLDIVSKPSLKVVKMDEEKPLVFTAEVAVKPEVKLGKYKGVEVAAKDREATDKDVEDELLRVQNQNARTVEITDRPAKDQDLTTIDFEGSVDGVPFEGGTGKDYPLTLGSHTFIGDFEDQVIGMNIGDVKDVKVKFPDEYHADALKGKDAVFKVTLKGIKEKQMPELDDDFAVDNGFDTLKEYKEDIKKKITENKETAATNALEREILDKIIEDTELDVPPAMLATQTDRMAKDVQNNIQQQGMTIDQYLKYMGLTMDQFLENLKPDAEKRIKQRLILEAIYKKEGLEVTDDEYNQEMQRYADNYKLELDDFVAITDDDGKEMIRTDVGIRKALELIVKEAKEVEGLDDKKEEKKSETKAKKTTTSKTSKASSDAEDEKKAEKKTTAKKTTSKTTTSKSKDSQTAAKTTKKTTSKSSSAAEDKEEKPKKTTSKAKAKSDDDAKSEKKTTTKKATTKKSTAKSDDEKEKKPAKTKSSSKAADKE